MSSGWGNLPLLPLRCILHHLSLEDAMAAMSTCNHWRSAILLYEGRKELLKMRTSSLERNLFVARVFRKHVKRLHIYIEHESDMDKYFNYILPQFFDSSKLTEVLFIGPSYVRSQHIPAVKLKRILTEALVFKHLSSLKSLAYLGCELDSGRNENDRYTHRLVEYYSRPFTYNGLNSPCDALLSMNNVSILAFSSLKHIIVDYERVNTDSIETLSRLPNFRFLSLNIVYRKQLELKPIDWLRLHVNYAIPLNVAVNVIALPYRKFNDLIENVLVEGLTLTSLKVMYCRCISSPLLNHVVRLYQSSLRELVWADTPYESTDQYLRMSRPARHIIDPEEYNVNPFILLCWQCVNLQRLVIHGYWVWQYDVVGLVRLRALRWLEVSSPYSRQARFAGSARRQAGGNAQVLAGDAPPQLDPTFVHQVNSYTEFPWQPVSWSALPGGLRARASPPDRLDYVLAEVAHPLGVT